MHPLRRAMSALEVMIASAIFVSIAGLAATSLLTGSDLKTTIANRSDASVSISSLVSSLAKELRTADIDRIAIDRSASGQQVWVYQFRINTGFNTSAASLQSLEQIAAYGRTVTLKFQQADTTGSAQYYGKLTRIDTDNTTGVASAERTLTDRLVWRQTLPGASTASAGFDITAPMQDGTTVVGDRLVITALGRPENITPTGEVSNPDTCPVLTASATVQLRSTMFNQFGVTAPVITSAGSAEGNLSNTLRYDITASHYPTSFASSSLPPGLSMTTTGVISGTPTTMGTYTSSVSASNSAGSDTKTVVFTIGGPTPVITSAVNASTIVGTSFSYVITATNSPTSWAVGTLPTGLSFNNSTHTIAGTCSTEGTYAITMYAINSYGSGRAVLTLTVSAAPLPAPVITSPTTATGQTSTSFSYQIQATNSPSSFACGTLPAGLSLNTANGVISGTPTVTGTTNLAISATNSSGTGTGTVAITIQAVPIPVVTSGATASATAGTTFTYTITASNSPTSYSATGLPAWLSGPVAGTISGTPTSSAVGTCSFTVAATNSYGTGSKTVTVAVASPPPPAITSVLSSSGTVGVAYTYTIAATNAPTSYAASGLPTGLTLDSTSGIISGTPTQNGSFTISLSATNSYGTGTATLTLTIAAPSTTPTVTLGLNTGNGNKFLVIGTVTAASGTTLDMGSFAWNAVNSSGTLVSGYTLKRGWVAGEAGNGANTLATNAFSISGSSPSGSLTLNAAIGDNYSHTGYATRSY